MGKEILLLSTKKEAYNLFSHLMEGIRATFVKSIFRIESQVNTTQPDISSEEKNNLQFHGASDQVGQFGPNKENKKEEKAQQPIINSEKVGRNEPCPCGSGKKYKKCCGK